MVVWNFIFPPNKTPSSFTIGHHLFYFQCTQHALAHTIISSKPPEHTNEQEKLWIFFPIHKLFNGGDAHHSKNTALSIQEKPVIELDRKTRKYAQNPKIYNNVAKAKQSVLYLLIFCDDNRNHFCVCVCQLLSSLPFAPILCCRCVEFYWVFYDKQPYYI